jgi:hypothetical protein
MGYQIASIVLKDGRKYDQAAITGGVITKIRNLEDIPFREDDIDRIIVTHDKWNFKETAEVLGLSVKVPTAFRSDGGQAGSG